MTFLLTLLAAFWPAFQMGTPAEKPCPVPVCTTDLLASIAAAVKLDKSNVGNCDMDTVVFIPFRDEELRVEVKYGRIEHIGLRLFTDTLIKIPEIAAPLKYLERTVLMNRLQLKRELSAAEEADWQDVIFSGTSLDKIPELTRTTKDMAVNCINDRIYSIEWYNDSARTATVSIPIRYSLLNGTSLPENERSLMQDLTQADSIFTVRSPLPVDDDLVQSTWKLNCFVVKGDTLYSRYFNSDRYYQMADTASEVFFKELYNQSYPVESLSNLLKGLGVPNDFRIKVKMVVYPRTLKTTELNLSTFAQYFLNRGCEIFTIPIEHTDETIGFWMICKNKPMGYCHSLKVSFNIKDIEGRSGLATASLAPYVPFNKINNLFAEPKWK